ncbi:hypothetical protein [Marilutibacter aestuarii]|uniref:hypothetical protein n=1 Tax=Marilutibacter aestuarii TaxID=1706195 RepID=UPI001FE9958C|nr:hypothetical protein [Lysobacter aestuarii]
MSAYAFRFDPSWIRSRVHAAASPRKPRQRWLRVAFGVVGVALLAVLVMFSVVVGAAMIAIGLLFRLWQQRGKPVARDSRVMDGEYRVLEKHRLPPVR